MDPYQPLKPSQIERAYFVLSHRDKLIKIATIVGILVVVAIYGWLTYSLVNLISAGSYESMAANVMPRSDWENYHLQRAPRDLEVKNATFVSIGESRYNLVADLVNPNTNWAVRDLEYHFVVNGENLPVDKAFVNPGEERLLLRTGYQMVLPINSVQVVIDNVGWRRFEDDAPIINWEVTDISYNPVRTIETSSGPDTLPAGVSWTARNLSLYNFWEVEFQIAIFSGDRIVGVNSTRAKDFYSLESRSMDVVWLNNLPRVNNVKIYPLVNWLDENNYKALDIQVEGVR